MKFVNSIQFSIKLAICGAVLVKCNWNRKRRKIDKKKIETLENNQQSQGRQRRSHLKRKTLLNGFTSNSPTLLHLLTDRFGLQVTVLSKPYTKCIFFQDKHTYIIHSTQWIRACMVIWIVNLLIYSLRFADNTNINTTDTIAINRTPNKGTSK